MVNALSVGIMPITCAICGAKFHELARISHQRENPWVEAKKKSAINPPTAEFAGKPRLVDSQHGFDRWM
jgi:hypothetical protein